MTKTHFYGFIVLLALAMTGCKKDEDKVTVPINTWQWSGYTFNANKATFGPPGANNFAAALNAMDKPDLPENVFHVDFMKVPTRSGYLHIITDGIENDDIRIYVYGVHGAYMSAPDANSKAYVSLVNGKVNLVISNALLTPFFGVHDTASIRLNAAIIVP